MRLRDEPLASILTGVAVFAVVSLVRLLGLADGVLLGFAPASGLALGAAVLLRGPGAVASAVGFVAAGLAFGLSPAQALLDGAAHGLAAGVGAELMRGLARRRQSRSLTSDWLIFLAGLGAFTAIVAVVRLAGAPLGLAPGAPSPLLAVFLTAVFEPLGILTVCAALFSLREWPQVVAAPRPALAILALASVLLGMLWMLFSLPQETISPSGWTLMLSVPFCLWIAMERRSLDGAVLSLAAVAVLLTMLVVDTGSILSREFVTAVLYLKLLVVICQLVHAVNRDRLCALAEVEARKRELEGRVAARTAQLMAMTEKALAADAAKTQFLATVSHEVRTPLNGVLGMTSVVLSADLDARTRRNVEIIRTSGFHLLDVINRILDYAQIAEKRAGSNVSDFDLDELIEEVLTEARFLPYARGLTLRVERDPALAARRHGDRHGLRQILTNLVGNAAKFTEAGSVVVRVRERAGLLQIEVEDAGVGVPLADQARIFEPFEQSDVSFLRKGGTGLGLAICAEVVRRLGGRIGVVSAPGQGSTFWFEVEMPPSDDAPVLASAALTES